MSEMETRDHVARDLAKTAGHDAQLVLSSLNQHLANCENNGRERLENFRDFAKEVREGFQKQSNSVSRVHGRIDRLLWAVILGFGAIVLAMAGAVGTLLMKAI